jgi:nitrite reductase/ring-hydroxylating ferredoxin subunit
MWQPLINRTELQEGVMRRVEVAGRGVVVVLNEGKPRAFNALCPHASADLSEGDVRPTYVICPLHNYRYELATGRCLKPMDGPRLKVYPVEWRGDVLWGDL